MVDQSVGKISQPLQTDDRSVHGFQRGMIRNPPRSAGDLMIGQILNHRLIGRQSADVPRKRLDATLSRMRIGPSRDARRLKQVGGGFRDEDFQRHLLAP